MGLDKDDFKISKKKIKKAAKGLKVNKNDIRRAADKIEDHWEDAFRDLEKQTRLWTKNPSKAWKKTFGGLEDEFKDLWEDACESWAYRITYLTFPEPEESDKRELERKLGLAHGSIRSNKDYRKQKCKDERKKVNVSLGVDVNEGSNGRVSDGRTDAYAEIGIGGSKFRVPLGSFEHGNSVQADPDERSSDEISGLQFDGVTGLKMATKKSTVNFGEVLMPALSIPDLEVNQYLVSEYGSLDQNQFSFLKGDDEYSRYERQILEGFSSNLRADFLKENGFQDLAKDPFILPSSPQIEGSMSDRQREAANVYLASDLGRRSLSTSGQLEQLALQSPEAAVFASLQTKRQILQQNYQLLQEALEFEGDGPRAFLRTPTGQFAVTLLLTGKFSADLAASFSGMKVGSQLVITSSKVLDRFAQTMRASDIAVRSADLWLSESPKEIVISTVYLSAAVAKGAAAELYKAYNLVDDIRLIVTVPSGLDEERAMISELRTGLEHDISRLKGKMEREVQVLLERGIEPETVREQTGVEFKADGGTVTVIKP